MSSLRRSEQQCRGTICRWAAFATFVLLLVCKPTMALNPVFPEREKLDQTRQWINAREYQKAISVLADLAKRYPANAEIAYWYGVSLGYVNRFSEAFEQLDRSIELAPENVRLRIEYSRILMQAERFDDAEKSCESTLALTSDARERNDINRLMAINRGKKLVKTNQLEAAVQHFQKAAQTYPNDIEILATLADVYMKQERWRDAEQLYRFLQSKDPQFTANLVQLLNIADKLGDDESKQRLLTTIVRQKPGEQFAQPLENALFAQAEEKIKQRQYVAATEDLSAILRTNPRHLKANMAMADMYMLQGKKEEAFNTLQYIEQQGSISPELYKILAPYYARLGKLDESIAQYEKLLKNGLSENQSKEINTNLNLLYNARSEQLLAEVKQKTSTSGERQLIVDLAKDWVKKGRDDAAKPLLEYVLADDGGHAEAHYWLATVLDRHRQYDTAIEHMTKSLELSNNNVSVRIALARIQARAEEFEQAEANYKKIVAELGNTPQAGEMRYLLDLVVGQRYAKQRRYQDAITHYQTMLERIPSDTTVRMQLANLYIESGNFRVAENELGELIQLHPENPAILWQLATLYEKTNRDAEKERVLRRVLQIDPNGFYGTQSINLLGMGEGLRKQKEKKWDEAIAWFEKVLALESNNLAALLGIANALLEKNELTDAARYLERAQTIDPGNIDLQLLSAKVLLKQERLDEAIVALSRIILLAKDRDVALEARVNLANLYRIRAEQAFSAGKIEQSLSDYRELYRLNPGDANAHLQTADIYLAYGKQQRSGNLLRRALQEYDMALAINPAIADAYANKGLIFEMFAQHELARQQFALALAYNVDSRFESRLVNDLKRQSVQLEFAKRNDQWVISELIDMQQREPGNDRYYYFLGIVYASREEYEEAIAQYLKVIELNPTNMQTRLRLAELYERTNEDLLAAAQYRLILQNTDNLGLQELARQRIPVAEDRARLFSGRFTYNVIRGATKNGDNRPYIRYLITNSRGEFNMRFRPRKDLLMNLNYSPTYTASHQDESDSLNHQYGMSLSANQRGKYWTGTLSYRDNEGLLLEDYRGSEINASFLAGQRFELPLFQADNGPSTARYFQLSLNVRDIKSTDISFYDVTSGSMMSQLISPFRSGGTWTLGYRFSAVGNRKIEAADYASVANRASIDLSLPLMAKLSASASFSAEIQNYLHNDSWEQLQHNQQIRRRITSVSVYASLNYEIHRQLSCIFDVSATESRSNLDIGAFYLVDGSNVNLVRVQSTQLADQRNFSSSVSMQFRF